MGLGHRPFRRRLLLDRGSLLRAARRLRAAGPAHRHRARRPPGILSGDGSGRREMGRIALAIDGRPLLPPAAAGHRLDDRGMAARSCLHGLRVESARACLGLRDAVAAGRGAVRRLRAGPADLHDPGRPGCGVARVDPRTRRGRRRGLCGTGRHGAGGHGGRRAAGAHRPAQYAAGGEMAPRESRTADGKARGNEPPRRVRRAGGGDLAGNGTAVRRATRFGGTPRDGEGRAARRLSPHRRGPPDAQSRRRGLELAAGHRRRGRDRRHLRQGPSRPPGRIHPLPQATRAGFGRHRTRLVRGR